MRAPYRAAGAPVAMMHPTYHAYQEEGMEDPYAGAYVLPYYGQYYEEYVPYPPNEENAAVDQEATITELGKNENQEN